MCFQNIIFNNVVLLLKGIGIGTGPGVIQDHYSPTMGRHRASQLFNGHVGNGNVSHQPQFEAGGKPFIKPSQVKIPYLFSILFVYFFCLSIITLVKNIF